jgi:hypothetical protein
MTYIHLAIAGLAGLCLTACDLGGNSGGSNSGQKNPGNMDDGVDLGNGDLAVSPRGTTFLARVDGELIHGDVDGSSRALPGLGDPLRLAFSPQREVVYVVLDGEPLQLAAHDLQADRSLWKVRLPLDRDAWDLHEPWLKVTSDDRHLVIVHDHDIFVFDAADGGRLATWHAADPVVDLDLSEDGSKAYVAFAETWKDGQPWTPFSTMKLPMLESETIWLPNCADEVVLDEQGTYAFMAPTTCRQDPVSVVDLSSGKFMRNLPGFGPVALASAGERAVAFMDLDNLDESLFLPADPMPKGDKQYHLMLIDTRTLEFTTVELGDSLPRYAPTPDGRLLLVDANAWYDDERVRIFDLDTGTFEPIYGPDVRLENFVLTRDSTRAFLVDEGAYELSIADRLLSSLPLSVIPTNLNITADDRWLLLQDEFGPVHVWDVQGRRIAAVVGEDPDRD